MEEIKSDSIIDSKLKYSGFFSLITTLTFYVKPYNQKQKLKGTEQSENATIVDSLEETLYGQKPPEAIASYTDLSGFEYKEPVNIFNFIQSLIQLRCVSMIDDIRKQWGIPNLNVILMPCSDSIENIELGNGSYNLDSIILGKNSYYIRAKRQDKGWRLHRLNMIEVHETWESLLLSCLELEVEPVLLFYKIGKKPETQTAQHYNMIRNLKHRQPDFTNLTTSQINIQVLQKNSSLSLRSQTHSRSIIAEDEGLRSRAKSERKSFVDIGPNLHINNVIPSKGDLATDDFDLNIPDEEAIYIPATNESNIGIKREESSIGIKREENSIGLERNENSIEIIKEETWVCEICDFDGNNIQINVCNSCGCKRLNFLEESAHFPRRTFSNLEIAIDESPINEELYESVVFTQADEWMCKFCHHVNVPTSFICDTCSKSNLEKF